MPIAVADTVPVNVLCMLLNSSLPAPVIEEPAFAALCWTRKLDDARSISEFCKIPVATGEPELE